VSWGGAKEWCSLLQLLPVRRLMVADVESVPRGRARCSLKVCRGRKLEAVESGAEQHTCTGEVDQVTGREIGG
jgi:hypothetical protein